MSAPDPKPPGPAKPQPPAKDSSIYGSQWGDTGKPKQPGPAPTDRPEKIEGPADKT
jgi:hypothetical protein